MQAPELYHHPLQKSAGVICHPEPSPSGLHLSELFHSCHQLNLYCEIRQRIFSSVSDPGWFLPGSCPWGAQAFKGYRCLYSTEYLTQSHALPGLLGMAGWLVRSFSENTLAACSRIKAQPREGHHTVMSAEERSLMGTGITSVHNRNLLVC